jgi:hypothetical protein
MGNPASTMRAQAVVDGGQACRHVGDPMWCKNERIAAGEDHLADLAVRGDVCERIVERLR